MPVVQLISGAQTPKWFAIFCIKRDFGRDFTEKRLDFNKVKSFEFRSRKSTESTNLSV